MGRRFILAVVATGAAIGYSVGWRPIQAQSPRSIWDGVYTDAQARRGEELYARNCSRCHGQDLAGVPGEPLRQAMPDEKGLSPRVLGDLDRTPELAGPTFYGNYDGLSLCDLVERARISMPQDRPGSLNRQQIVDVVAYLLLQGGFPLGRTELTTRFDDLQEIRIRAHKPSVSAPVPERSCHLPAWK